MPYKNPERRRELQRGYSAKHYAENCEVVKDATSRYRKRKKAEWAAFKETLSCEVCGENNPHTLDFHHREGEIKLDTLNNMKKTGAFGRMQEEIKKCSVLCANCHRKHHSPIP